MEAAARALPATATATLDAREGAVLSIQLTAGADAATATIRTGGSGGDIIGKVGAAIGLSASHTYASGVPYVNLHVTITGTTPVFVAEVL